MQFHLIVVSIFLKTCVKDRGDSSSRLLERKKDLFSLYRGAFVSGFLTFWSTLTNYRIIYKPLDRFFKKFMIPEINLPFI